MIDYTDVDAKLDEYSEAFDFYMEYGTMPPTIHPDDFLAGYIQETIDNNPQIVGSDPVWIEVLKENLIAFFVPLLMQFQTLQLESIKELTLIIRFRNADIDKKRAMWPQVCKVIQASYSEYAINLAGYTIQFKNKDKESVFAALTSDWESACKKNLYHRERKMFERSKKNFEIQLRNTGAQDYEDKKKIDSYLYRYPQLKEIVEMIGREKISDKEEKDSIIYKFLPIAIAKNSSVEEIDRVESGDNLERVLPVELSMPEDLFFKRYATKELQLLSGPGKEKPRKVEDHHKTPRPTKGPIIVSIDTSGSMSGEPLKIAFSLLKQLLKMAKQQKRSCFLISFSVRSKSIDLSKPRNWGRIDHFLENSFSGGTDGEQMLAETIRVLQGGMFEMADVLIISDLQFPTPVPETQEKINREKGLGTRFYALQIGKENHQYRDIMDKIWKI